MHRNVGSLNIEENGKANPKYQWDGGDRFNRTMAKEMFSTDATSTLTLTEMVEHLQLNRFGSFPDEKTKRQILLLG